MRKKKMAVLAIILTAALMIGIMPAKIALADTYGMTGSGTASDPYIIKTAQQLANIPNVSLSAYYKIGNNIDLSIFGQWTPIGTSSSPFTGTLNGADYTISNLVIGSSSSPKNSGNNGLFGTLSGTVTNLNIKDSSIYVTGTGSAVGILAGGFSSATVSNCNIIGIANATQGYVGGYTGYTNGTDSLTDCVFSGSVYSVSGYAGGLVGQDIGTTYLRCTNHATVTSANNSAGGIVGYGWSTISISHCGNTGNISALGTGPVGGIVGLSARLISFCYNTGNIVGGGGGIAGGIVGACTYANISNCYNAGSVGLTSIAYNGYDDVSGIAGADTGSGVGAQMSRITNCYNVGAINTGHYLAGIISNATYIAVENCYSSGTIKSGTGIDVAGIATGYNLGTSVSIANSYYNSDKAISTVSAGGSGTYDGAAESTSYMQSQTFCDSLNSTASYYQSYGAVQHWQYNQSVNYGYPYLSDLNIDVTPPAGSYSLSKSAWTCKPVVITVTATDDQSGVASITLPDSTVVSAATATYTVTDNGTYNFTLADNAGNTYTYPVTVSNIDRNVSVTHEQTVAYTIDPNSSSLSGGTITLANNDPHIGVAVYVSNLVSNGIADVEPNSFDWSHLNAAQTKRNLAIGIQVIPAGGGWGVEPHCTGGAGLCQRHHRPGAPGCNQPGQHWDA